METQEHYIKVAEGFGLSHKEPAMTRRSFLRGLVATGALVAAPSGLWVPQEPKIHQVAGGIGPEHVFPNLIDSRTGLPIHLRDFKEDDKYDTVVIPASYGGGMTYNLGTPLVSYFSTIVGLAGNRE